MATESPLIHDGSQCTAAANLYNPGTPLDGPGGSGQFLCVNITAARSVNVQTSAGGSVYGILQNTPPSGQPADVGILGVTKAVAGAAISAGAVLSTDSAGRVVTQSSSALAIGMAIEAATAANQIITIALVPGLGQT